MPKPNQTVMFHKLNHMYVIVTMMMNVQCLTTNTLGVSYCNPDNEGLVQLPPLGDYLRRYFYGSYKRVRSILSGRLGWRSCCVLLL